MDDLVDAIATHLSYMPVLRDSDEEKEQWWLRSFDLQEQALEAGLVPEGEPNHEW